MSRKELATRKLSFRGSSWWTALAGTFHISTTVPSLSSADLSSNVPAHAPAVLPVVWTAVTRSLSPPDEVQFLGLHVSW